MPAGAHLQMVSLPVFARKKPMIEEGKMTNSRHEQRIQERAYGIWERAGRPEGKSVEHWLQAEAEIAVDEQELDEELKLEAEGVV